MKVNLANLYAFLLERYGEQYSVTYATAPTYLQSIVGQLEAEEKKIVFVYLERRGNKVPSPVSPSCLSVKQKASDNLDLTGSPLKDDCIIDDVDISIDLKMMDLKMGTATPWNIGEEYHKGIDVEKALNIICSEPLKKEQSCNDVRGSVWILCNGIDAQKTLLVQLDFIPQFRSRGIVTFFGLTPASALSSVQPLLRKHFTAIRPGTAIDTFVDNVYEVKSDIMVHCSWSTTASLPALINLTSCDVVLSQTFRLSECGPLTQDLINQLRILTCIREDILAYKESETNNETKEPIYRCGCGIEKDDLSDGISKIMTEVSGFVENDVRTEIENDIETVVQTAKLRRLTDLTDKLWDLLKRCSSYKELKTAFQLLFQCAARCNIINMPTNKNRLAEIITEVSNRRLAIPCLTGTEPLELLLEIGLEKLYKDYEFIFMQSKICSPNSLKRAITIDENKTENGNALSNVRKSLRNAIVKQETATPRKTLLHNVTGRMRNTFEEVIGFKNSYFDENATAVQISKLLQIHCALEHLLMIQINLNLQNVYTEICEQLLSRPFQSRYTNIDESFIDKMDISIPAHNIREHFEGKEPYSRRITFKSSNKFRQSKTTFFYSVENICPPGLSECFENCEKEITKEHVYYSWIYQKIQTLK